MPEGDVHLLVLAGVALLQALTVMVLQRVAKQTKRAPRRRTDPVDRRTPGQDVSGGPSNG